MELNIMRGFFAMISRMKYIDRWGLMRCTRTETLSEHTLETAMLSHALIEIANARFEKELDPGKAVLLAMYHDSAEIITGDLPTPVKYHNDEIKHAYDSIEEVAIGRLLKMLPDDLKPAFERSLSPDEDTLAIYEPYVKAADKLSALIKCVEELKAGNAEFKMAHQSVLSHKSLQIPEAQFFINEFLPAYALSLDELEHFE